MLRSSKHWWLWEEPAVMCGNWNVKQATSQQVFWIDHLLYGYMLPVFFATDQLYSPPRSAEIQPMSQQDATSTRPYCGLVLDTRSLAARPRRGSLPVWSQDCWLATCQDWWTGVFHGVEARLCHEHDVLAHCLAGRQTCFQQCCGSLLAVSASSTRLSNTARWFLLQAQWRWAWYSQVWIL